MTYSVIPLLIMKLKIILKLHLQRAEKAPHTLTISLIAPGTSPFSSLAILNKKFTTNVSKIAPTIFFSVIHFLIEIDNTITGSDV